MRRLIGTVAAVVALVAAIAGALWKAHDIGKQAGIAESAAVLAEWKLAVAAQAAERRKAQREQLALLQGELDELRNRPERVRTVVRKVEVRADDRCVDLPADYRRLWNAGYESGLRVGTATATARLDDAGRVAVAEAAAAVAEARERFETNAARLTALQAYVRAISPKEPEQ